jgi:nucleoside-diphosphate-sugar epimerase
VNVLLTGSSGFIASKLKKRLRDLGHQVEPFDIAQGQDICNADHLAAVADLNWARVHPIETMKINVEGTWNIANACRLNGTLLLFASTMCVYGNQKTHPDTEETLPNPAEIYACTKLAGESVIKGFHHTYGLEYVMMRFATIYGEGTRPALGTHIFLRQALKGEPITVHGDGQQTRTLTHIDDLIDAIIAAYQSGKVNETWNMTTQEEVSALQMAETIKSLTGSKSPIVFIPQRVGQTFRESVSAEKIKRDTGWEAKVKWDDGIRRMYKWFKETGQINNVYNLPQ